MFNLLTSSHRPGHLMYKISNHTLAYSRFQESPTFLALSKKSKSTFSNSSYERVPVFHMHKI